MGGHDESADDPRGNFLASVEGHISPEQMAELREIIMNARGGVDALVTALQRFASANDLREPCGLADELELVRRWGAAAPAVIGDCWISRSPL